MQYSRGLIGPAAWRAARDARPTDPYTRLGLAQALIVRAFEADADEVGDARGDELSILAECARTLASIDGLEGLSNCDALLYGSTTARCATRLSELGRPRLALTILAPAIALLDERAGKAGCAPCELFRDASPGSSNASAPQATAHAARPDFVALSPEDTAPGELFTRQWPLPGVSWQYMRATLAATAGSALLLAGDHDRAIDELSHAALIAMVGAPLDYTRTAQLSEEIGRRLEEALDLEAALSREGLWGQ
ncbi:hypothetical protein [Demequina salsinemoris]|uniref:hypothetical protein n=1 Tax=Demequina salsinemoris TaxID=577470 RepID=UPI0007832819|nr:hypothetical protein [Demequina salsinemoris]